MIHYILPKLNLSFQLRYGLTNDKPNSATE